MTPKSRLPVVLLPGLQSDHRSWHHQIEAFGGDTSIIVPEGQQRLGSIAQMADCVLAQLPPRFHLVAWSMGGYIALHALPALAERLASLVLVGTSAHPETPDQTARRREAIALARREGIAAAARASMATSCVAPARLDPIARAGVLDAWEDIGLAAFERQQAACIDRPDTRPNLACIRCPTTILVGEADLIAPPDRAQAIHDAVAGSVLRTLPDCGHCPPLEFPETVNDILARQWGGFAAATR